MAHDVFISYSSKDKPTADAACAKLESHGIRCWIAPRDIVPGADWGASIIDAINSAKVTVLVFSANANLSAQIKREVERAINLMPVIPLRIENIAPERSLEFFLSTPHWLDAFTPPLEHHLDYLADVIRHIIDGQAIPPPPPPPPPPWWKGPLGLAAAGAIVVLLAIVAWFGFLRPPPSFIGTWTATALDFQQYHLENSLVSAEVPSPMLTAAMKNPETKGTLTIDASGQYTLSIIGQDHGTVTANPEMLTGAFNNNTLTFTSDITHQSLSTNLMLFQNNTGYQVQTDPPPNGQTSFNMMLMQAGQNSGAPSGDFAGKPMYVGTPDGSGNMRTLDLISTNWIPMPMNTQIPGYNVTNDDDSINVTLKITPDGHYVLNYALHEKSLWHAADGNWTRSIPSFGVISAPASDTGTYSFSGRDQFTLYDQSASSTWQRGT